MHWPVFAVTLFITAVLHITLGRFISFGQGFVRPDFLALLALFFALYAPRRHAPLVCWIIGFAADLLGLAPPGAFAFSFGLLALLTLRARMLVYPDHPISRIILAFFWTFFAQAFVFAIPCLFGRISFSDLLPYLALSSRIGLYTALFTPVYYFMASGKSWLGIPLSSKRF